MKVSVVRLFHCTLISIISVFSSLSMALTWTGSVEVSPTASILTAILTKARCKFKVDIDSKEKEIKVGKRSLMNCANLSEAKGIWGDDSRFSETSYEITTNGDIRDGEGKVVGSLVGGNLKLKHGQDEISGQLPGGPIYYSGTIIDLYLVPSEPWYLLHEITFTREELNKS